MNQTNLEGRKNGISDVEKLIKQSDKLVKLIESELKLLPLANRNTSNIFIGGVAQGGMLALSTFMRYKGPDPLGGVVSLLGYEPLPWLDMEDGKVAEKW